MHTIFIAILIVILLCVIFFLLTKRRSSTTNDYAHFKDFLDNLNIPICIKDAYTQEVFYINASYKKILVHQECKSLKELIRCNLSQESYEAAVATEVAMTKSRKGYDSFESITLSNGKEVDTYTTKSIVKWKGTERVLCIRYDMCDKQRVMGLDHLINRTLPPIKAFSWEVDNVTHKINYNFGNTCFTGIDRFDTIEEFLEIIHPDDKEKYLRSVEDAFAKGDCYFSCEYRSCTSEAKGYHWWELRCIAKTIYSTNGNYVCLYGLTISIDEAKKREQILIEQREELKQARNKAEEVDKLKSQFLANMSHEIRTPLNAIVGFSELLIDSVKATEREEYFNIIKFNNEILLKLINDIIELSKIEVGLELKPVRGSFVIFFNQIARSLKKLSTSPDVEFILENPYEEAIAHVDFVYIAQIINNYVTNAIKNTTQGSITLGYTYQEDSEMLEVYVKDTGVGIPASKQTVIFERFRKLDQYKQGAGLGLNIVKAIAGQLGFECGFESTPDLGSYFWIRGRCPLFIPTTEQRQEITPLMENCVKDGSNERKLNEKSAIKILIAEDTDSNYDLVKAILHPYQLARALNGYEALLLIQENDYDLILMDIRMPLMDGLEATREIRKLGKDIPIVALSANTFDEDKIQAYEAGCDMYLEKPIRKQEIIELIENLIKDRHAQ